MRLSHIFRILQQTLLHVDRLVHLFKDGVKQGFDDVEMLLFVNGTILLQYGYRGGEVLMQQGKRSLLRSREFSAPSADSASSLPTPLPETRETD